MIPASVDPCSNDYAIGSWRREGCDFSLATDLGYEGELFAKPADMPGTATWTPNLPQSGKYQVLIFIPKQDKFANGVANYQIVTSNGVVIDSFVIDQSTHQISRNGIPATNRDGVELLSIGHRTVGDTRKPYGAWVSVAVYELTAGKETSVRLVNSVSHAGSQSDRVSADTVRFDYVGENTAPPPPPPEDPPPGPV